MKLIDLAPIPDAPENSLGTGATLIQWLSHAPADSKGFSIADIAKRLEITKTLKDGGCTSCLLENADYEVLKTAVAGVRFSVVDAWIVEVSKRVSEAKEPPMAVAA